MHIRLALFFFVSTVLLQAQNPNRFQNDVVAIGQKYDSIWNPNKETILFTGSSSIRMWKNLESKFPNTQIVNTGFGGSETSDLLALSNELIHRYKPVKVFIYEGDNDISADKKPKDVINDMKMLILDIRTHNPNTGIVIIAAKPSLARWNLKRKYKRLNKRFKRIAKNDAQIDYVDIWEPMLLDKKVKRDIFLEDGLHMNEKGYDIWYQAMKSYIEY